MTQTLPLVVIVGPTASGKTSLAIEIATTCGGEIICADSRTIYKDLNIGTAKPGQVERALVPHWGLDLIEPGQGFSAADFKRYALDKIAEIRSRNHIPIMVGGTGLYIDSVLFDYQFGAPPDDKLRAHFDTMSLNELHDYCKKNNVTLPENKNNKRYVVRAIENANSSPKGRTTPIANTIIVGITSDRDTLRTQIGQRIEQMFADGIVNEAIMLGKKYGTKNEAMKSNIYPLVYQYVGGGITLSEAKEKCAVLDWRLAKRQLTWLRRNSFIQWLSLSDTRDYLLTQLAIYK